MKLLTFTWSVSIEAPDTFDGNNPSDVEVALKAAWLQVQEGDGELTDEQEEEDFDETPKKTS